MNTNENNNEKEEIVLFTINTLSQTNTGEMKLNKHNYDIKRAEYELTIMHSLLEKLSMCNGLLIDDVIKEYEKINIYK